ncbi:uncharacterized mitochondrial protein AtMg00820-like [Phaseolus vulgaris]|uniref:uncharacterized mitochondrial protein AtMg00820-like n=1 Tax=Phaseolus vulgaris TaxID=3885 RepID=UPI0035CC357D
MNEELMVIEKNNTWQLTDLPKGHKEIDVKWVYKIKVKANGEIDKYKARLVAKGFEQREGYDYEEIFSPVARMETIRLIIALTAQRQWKNSPNGRQAPTAWNKRIDSFLHATGFKKCASDHGSNLKMISDFKHIMMKEFEMTDLGLISYFIGH